MMKTVESNIMGIYGTGTDNSTVTVSLTSPICLLTVIILCISEWNESDHHPDT